MTKSGHIHAARLDSPRLQRVLAVLSDSKPHSTRGLIRKAQVAAVNAIISELRQHGAVIDCQQQRAPSGRGRRWIYTLKKAPTTE